MADAAEPPTEGTDSSATASAALRLAERDEGITVIVEEEASAQDPDDAEQGDDRSAARPKRGASRGAGRHSAREVALQVLYALDLGKRDFEYGIPTDSAPAAASAADSQPRTRDGSEAHASIAPVGRASASALAAAAGRRGEAFDRITEHFEVPPAAIDFARELVESVVTRSEQLDNLLGAHARNWRVARMAAVDRNVLRIAVFELSETDTPIAVVIDEAVDLARRFGSDTSPAFVNGVLDSVAREVRAA